MISVSCVTLLVIVAMASAAPTIPTNKPYYDPKDAPALFEKFIKDHNRNYKDEGDKQAHFAAFQQSLETINKANKESDTAYFDINNFADYTPEERKHMFGLIVPEKLKQ